MESQTAELGSDVNRGTASPGEVRPRQGQNREDRTYFVREAAGGGRVSEQRPPEGIGYGLEVPEALRLLRLSVSRALSVCPSLLLELLEQVSMYLVSLNFLSKFAHVDVKVSNVGDSVP